MEQLPNSLALQVTSPNRHSRSKQNNKDIHSFLKPAKLSSSNLPKKQGRTNNSHLFISSQGKTELVKIHDDLDSSNANIVETQMNEVQLAGDSLSKWKSHNNSPKVPARAEVLQMSLGSTGSKGSAENKPLPSKLILRENSEGSEENQHQSHLMEEEHEETSRQNSRAKEILEDKKIIIISHHGSEQESEDDLQLPVPKKVYFSTLNKIRNQKAIPIKSFEIGLDKQEPPPPEVRLPPPPSAKKNDDLINLKFEFTPDTSMIVSNSLSATVQLPAQTQTSVLPSRMKNYLKPTLQPRIMQSIPSEIAQKRTPFQGRDPLQGERMTTQPSKMHLQKKNSIYAEMQKRRHMVQLSQKQVPLPVVKPNQNQQGSPIFTKSFNIEKVSGQGSFEQLKSLEQIEQQIDPLAFTDIGNDLNLNEQQRVLTSPSYLQHYSPRSSRIANLLTQPLKVEKKVDSAKAPDRFRKYRGSAFESTLNKLESEEDKSIKDIIIQPTKTPIEEIDSPTSRNQDVKTKIALLPSANSGPQNIDSPIDENEDEERTATQAEPQVGQQSPKYSRSPPSPGENSPLNTTNAQALFMQEHVEKQVREKMPLRPDQNIANQRISLEACGKVKALVSVPFPILEAERSQVVQSQPSPRQTRKQSRIEQREYIRKVLLQSQQVQTNNSETENGTPSLHVRNQVAYKQPQIIKKKDPSPAVVTSSAAAAPKAKDQINLNIKIMQGKRHLRASAKKINSNESSTKHKISRKENAFLLSQDDFGNNYRDHSQEDIVSIPKAEEEKIPEEFKDTLRIPKGKHLTNPRSSMHGLKKKPRYKIKLNSPKKSTDGEQYDVVGVKYRTGGEGMSLNQERKSLDAPSIDLHELRSSKFIDDLEQNLSNQILSNKGEVEVSHQGGQVVTTTDKTEKPRLSVNPGPASSKRQASIRIPTKGTSPFESVPSPVGFDLRMSLPIPKLGKVGKGIGQCLMTKQRQSPRYFKNLKTGPKKIDKGSGTNSLQAAGKYFGSIPNQDLVHLPVPVATEARTHVWGQSDDLEEVMPIEAQFGFIKEFDGFDSKNYTLEKPSPSLLRPPTQAEKPPKNNIIRSRNFPQKRFPSSMTSQANLFNIKAVPRAPQGESPQKPVIDENSMLVATEFSQYTEHSLLNVMNQTTKPSDQMRIFLPIGTLPQGFQVQPAFKTLDQFADLMEDPGEVSRKFESSFAENKSRLLPRFSRKAKPADRSPFDFLQNNKSHMRSLRMSMQENYYPQKIDIFTEPAHTLGNFGRAEGSMTVMQERSTNFDFPKMSGHYYIPTTESPRMERKPQLNSIELRPLPSHFNLLQSPATIQNRGQDYKKCGNRGLMISKPLHLPKTQKHQGLRKPSQFNFMVEGKPNLRELRVRPPTLEMPWA